MDELAQQALKDHIHKDFSELKLDPSIKKLIIFQKHHKYALMAFQPALQKELGQIVANKGKLEIHLVVSDYEAALEGLLVTPISKGKISNALMHIFGYFKGKIQAQEKEDFIKEIENFHNDMRSYDSITEKLRGWAKEYNMEYIEVQSLLKTFR